jgi:hypothetical protein
MFTLDDLKAFEERNMGAALFLDIKSAYDIHILVDRIKETGLPDNLLVFILNLT